MGKNVYIFSIHLLFFIKDDNINPFQQMGKLIYHDLYNLGILWGTISLFLLKLDPLEGGNQLEHLMFSDSLHIKLSQCEEVFS